MRNQYLLIDFENVQPKSLPSPSEFPLKVFVFVGETQKKVSIELATMLQAFGDDGAYIQMSGSGKNALDFHIAYYIGELAAKDPNAFFHVVSKDKGFDPLLEHLRQRKILVRRVSELSELILVRRSLKARVNSFSQFLAGRGAHRPTTREKLRNTAQHFFLHSPHDDTEIDAVIESLQKRGDLSLEGEAITYHYPESAALSS